MQVDSSHLSHLSMSSRENGRHKPSPMYIYITWHVWYFPIGGKTETPLSSTTNRVVIEPGLPMCCYLPTGDRAILSQTWSEERRATYFLRQQPRQTAAPPAATSIIEVLFGVLAAT